MPTRPLRSKAVVYDFLKYIQNYESSGPCGFTCEFFKFFERYRCPITIAINNSCKIGQFSESNKLCIITCIPKLGKPISKMMNHFPV